MTDPTRRDVAKRLDDLEDDQGAADDGGWRDMLDLPADAPRSAGYIRFIKEHPTATDEAWEAWWHVGRDDPDDDQDQGGPEGADAP